MRFGASIWPWKWNTPYGDAIGRLGKAGFRATELIAWNADDMKAYYTPNEVAHLRTVLTDNDMLLSQFVVNNSGAADQDPAIRRASIDMFKAGVDTGVALGASIINSVTHVPFGMNLPWLVDRPAAQIFTVELSDGLDWERNWNDYIDVLRECSAYAESAGVTYSLEPHPFRYGANTDGLLRLIEAVGSPALGVNVDPSHLFPVGEIPAMAIQRLGSRVVHCHFSDNDGETNVHWRPGKGKIDWKQTLSALKSIDFAGVVSLEFEDIPGVSRGPINANDLPTHGAHRAIASDEFEAEYQVALAFLTELAQEVGLHVE